MDGCVGVSGGCSVSFARDLTDFLAGHSVLFLHVCTFLDCRFKLTQQLNSSTVEAIKETVKDEMTQVGTRPTPTQEVGTDEQPNKTYKTALGKIFGEQLARANASLEALPQCVDKELEQYTPSRY